MHLAMVWTAVDEQQVLSVRALLGSYKALQSSSPTRFAVLTADAGNSVSWPGLELFL